MRLSLTRDEFKRYVDNTTRWLRCALLLNFKLADLGYKEEADRILMLSKQEVTEELEDTMKARREYAQRR